MLTVKQRRALAAELSNPSRAAAARACGMSESALVKYGKVPEYKAALAAGRDAQMQEAVQSLTACTGAAVGALRKIVDDPTTQDMNKIAAARALLEFALRFSESAGSVAVPTVVIVDDLPRTAPPGLLGAGSENDEQEGDVKNE